MGVRSYLTGTILILIVINSVCSDDDESSIVNTIHDENLIVVEERLYRHRRDTVVEGSGDLDTTTTTDVVEDSTLTFLDTTLTSDSSSDLSVTDQLLTGPSSSVVTTVADPYTTTSDPVVDSSDTTLEATFSTSQHPNISTSGPTPSPNTTLPPTPPPSVSIYGLTHQNSQRHIADDDSVSMACYFFVSPPRDDVVITWYKFDQPITSAGRLSIETTITASNYTTELTLDKAVRRDTGNYSCSASADGVRESVQLQLNVYEPVRVMLSPSVVSLQGDMQLNFTCTVSNPADIEAVPGRLFWCFGEDNITDETRITVVSPGHEVLTLNISQSEGTYGCGVVECTETANFVIYTDEDKSCEEEEDKQGTVWPQTVGDTLLIIPCPSGFVGTIERYCNTEGVWEAADYIKCVNQKIAQVNTTLTSIQEGTASVQEVKVVLTELSSVNLSASTASAGDLDTSIDVVSNIVSVLKTTSPTVFNIDKNTAESFLNIVDNILSADTSAEGQWQQVQQQEPSKAAGLMDSVTSFGLTAAKSQLKNTSLEITTNNLVVEIGNNMPGDIHFPRNADFKDDFVFPGSNFQLNDEDVTFVAVSYKTMENFLPKNSSIEESDKLVNSDIIALAVEIDGKEMNRLFDDIGLNFHHTQVNFTEPACGYWDFQDSQWKTDGCTAKEVNATYTSCSCNHLTNFAILMTPTSDVSEETEVHLKIITIVGCSLTILGCVITLITHRALWKYVRSDRIWILMNLCVCLILAYTVFLAGVERTDNQAACTAVSALLHYFFLAAFFLMLSVGPQSVITRYSKYYLLPLSWGLPAIVVGVTLGATMLDGYGNEKNCWVALEDWTLYAFVGPALVIMLVHLLLIVKLLKVIRASNILKSWEKKQTSLAAYRDLLIMPFLGVTWVLGVFSVNEDSAIYTYLFAIFNTLQGFLIVLLYTVFSIEIRDGLRQRKHRFDSKNAIRALSFYQGKDNDWNSKEGIRMKEAAYYYHASNDSLYGSNNSDSNETPETPETPWQDQVIDDESYPLPRVTIPNSATVPPVTRVSTRSQDRREARDVESKVYRSSYTEESPRQRQSSVKMATTSFQTNDDDVTRYTNRIERPTVERQPRSGDVHSRSSDEVQPLRVTRSSYSNDVYLAERRVPAEQRDVTQRAYSNGAYESGDDYRPTAVKRSSDYTVYRGDDPRMPSCYSQRQEEPAAQRRQRKPDVYVSDDHLQYQKPMFNTHL